MLELVAAVWMTGCFAGLFMLVDCTGTDSTGPK